MRAAAAFAIAILPAAAAAQTGALQQRLARATTLACSFSLVATGTWKAGAAAIDVAPAKLAITFTSIDADDGTAEIKGRSGESPLVVRYVSDYLHLMQMHSAGPLYTTTVLAKESAGGRLMAVHTRHEYTDVRLPGFTSRPEVYVGDCEVGP